MTDRENDLSSKRVAGNKFTLTVHNSAGSAVLDALWPDGHACGFVSTPFQTLGFLKAFYAHLPDNCSALIISVHDEASGRLAMVLPLIRRRTAALCYIEAADLGLADYAAPIIADWFHPAQKEMTAIWAKLRSALPQADILLLKKLPARLEGGRPNPLVLLPNTMDMATITKTAALNDCDAPSHYRKSGIYKDGMKKLRKLRTLGSVEFRLAQTEDEALVLFDHLVEQRLTRFQSLDRPEPLAILAIREFYREFVGKGVGARQLLFGGLYIDGQCIATDLGILNGKTLHRIINSMNTGEWSRHSPGTIVFMLMLDEASQHGVRYCDIGVGEYAYKERLTGTEMQLYERHEVLAMRGGIALAVARARRFARRGLSRFPQLRPQAEALRRRLCRWGLLTH